MGRVLREWVAAVTRRGKRAPEQRVEPLPRGGAVFEHGMLRVALLPFEFGNASGIGDTMFDRGLDGILWGCVQVLECYGLAKPDLREIGAVMRSDGLEPPPESAGHHEFLRAAPASYLCVTLRDGLPPDAEANRAHPAHVAVELIGRIGELMVGLQRGEPCDRLINQAAGIGLAYGRLEAANEWQDRASAGEAVIEAAGRGGRERRKALVSIEGRIACWRAELAARLRPDGRPTRGAISEVARKLAKAFGTTPARERRFYYERETAILNP